MTKLLALFAVAAVSAAGAGTTLALSGGENPARARADSAPTKLAIVHVRKGCHVWSKGSFNGVTVRLK